VTYYALAICLALAAFIALNAVGSSAAAASWLCLRRHAGLWPAHARARILFALRVLPAACALAFVAALLIPAYLVYEPYPAPDTIGLPLLALAALSAACVAHAAYRATASLLATGRLTAAWLRRAEPIHVEGVGVRAYRLGNATPVLAVVGTLRPRLFVASKVLDSLSAEELAVALAHERGHLLARDTLKRALMNFCRDLMPFVGVGRALERAWAEESERAADEYAARSRADGALDLAAALIKITRLMPAGTGSVVASGAFLLEGADEGVAGRVRRLTEMASARKVPAPRESFFSKALAPVFFLLPAAALVAAADRQTLATVHALAERVVKLLA
jgi:hypothetical protein